MVLVTVDGRPVPSWLRELADAARTMELSPFLVPPASGGRHSAVLVLFADGPDGPDLLFIQRSKGLRLHADETAFPGGVIDATDDGPVAAALREAAEEVGIAAGGRRCSRHPARAVHPADRLPGRSGACLVARPARRGARLIRVKWLRSSGSASSELADPAVRLMLHRPRGIVLPAFRVRGMLIWGMTAELVDRLLALAGWERQWDDRVVELS